ncbi:hypothetical protein [Actinomadura sp. 6N118]|uniref:hypothetical protein n=1 Tax=Actinomadura sp. 6N118 TaxID=3375151 RepID=UPI0037AF549A
MGWNTSALFVRGRSIDEVEASLPDVVDYVPTEEQVSADHAWSQSPGQRLYLAETDGWCQLWDPDQRLPPNVDRWLTLDALGALKGTQALAVLLSSVMSTYALWLYDDCELVRHVSFVNGEPTTEIGASLQVESGIDVPSWGPDEDFVWAVIKDVTGLSSDMDQLFAVYELDEF